MSQPSFPSPTSEPSVAPENRLEAYLLGVIRGKPGLLPMLLRGVLTALAPVYRYGLDLYLLPYNLGILKRKRLPCPVISIGNLTTGGTGKTPMTQRLCRHLQTQGKRVAVLSRGYRGQNEFGCAVVSDGEKVLLNAKEAGDEVYLLAKSLPGIPIVVGKDRRVTGALACARFQPNVIVLDDGLQYWYLHRDLDMVLLNACDPFDNGWTFPRGLLREPPPHLKRAGIVVLTNVRRAGAERVSLLEEKVQQLAPGRPVFRADLAPTRLHALLSRETYPVDWLAGRKIASLCAVGNPASFEAMLEEQSAELVGKYRFRDHAAIALPDLERVLQEACGAGAEALVITEKDAVKMPLFKSPLLVLALHVEMQVEHEDAFLAAVKQWIQ